MREKKKNATDIMCSLRYTELALKNFIRKEKALVCNTDYKKKMSQFKI